MAMSDIRTIRQQLRPWPSHEDPRRYYVNDWTDRIRGKLIEYQSRNPRCPSISLLSKVGKVWYDNTGMVHVDGIYDQNLAAFIWRTMTDTQFTEDQYDPSRNARWIDWPRLVDKVPCRVEDGLCLFLLKGRTYRVDEEFLELEKMTNPAYIGVEGTRFESESIELQELVLQLIADEEYNCLLPWMDGIPLISPLSDVEDGSPEDESLPIGILSDPEAPRREDRNRKDGMEINLDYL